MGLNRPLMDLERSCWPEQASYGPKEFSYGPKQASYGPEEFSHGPKQASYGPEEFSYMDLNRPLMDLRGDIWT